MTNPAGWLLLIFGTVGLSSSKLTQQRWRGIQWYPAAFGLIISVWSVTGLLSWLFEDFRKIWICDTPRRHCVFFGGISIAAGAYLLQQTALNQRLALILGRPLILVPLIIGTLLFFSCAVLRATDSYGKSSSNS